MKYRHTWLEPKRTARSKLMQGKPAECIVKQGQIHDLVVMGTHGRSRLDKLMLGSLAEEVVRQGVRVAHTGHAGNLRSQTLVLVVPCPELD
jgi:hypothetical protein